MPPFDAPPRRADLSTWLPARIVERLRELALEPGTHIGEQGLADHFQVSRTPIRAALAALVDSGVVAREPNRGFFLAQPPSGLAGAEVAAPKDDKLYYRIAEDRLAGKISQQVTESELAGRYKVARKRIAGTLARMADEGWVERRPWQRWAFAPMLDSVKGYADGYRYRALIEPAALRQPDYHLPPETLQRLRDAQHDFLENNAKYSDAQAFELGSNFHEALVGGSGNAFLIDGLRRVNSVRRLFEYRAKRDRASILGQYREHIAMLDAIEKGQLERAAKLMEKHLVGAGKMKARLVSQPKPQTTKE